MRKAVEPLQRAAESMRKAALDPQRGTLLAPLLRPRVPGTQGAIDARNHIMTELKKSGWDIDIHDFVAETPRGDIPMANILASRKQHPARPKLTLAAHYDSKINPEGFIGAIDSAFPCALLLYLASLEKKVKREFDLIFFDGEEALENWTETDSIYGARALAELQEKQGTLPRTLVLLDLLGDEAKFPIPSWFPNTHYLHKELSNINPKLVGGRPLHQYAGMMQDDHIPFLKRGVPVLHLIPFSFPDQWHTLDDNAECLHWESMEQWAQLFEEWLYE